jgi:hypothetical protein
MTLCGVCAMFGIPKCDPWIGPEYKHVTLKLLVLGESRYDEDFTDSQDY